MRRRKLRHRSASRPCSTSTSTRRSLANPDLELREAVRDKAQELRDTEEHRELATLEEPQDMGQHVLKTNGCVDAPAIHQEASLELQATAEVALEESDLEALARHILEQEYTLEAAEESDILGLAHIMGLVHIS